MAAIFKGKSFILIAATKRVGLIQVLGLMDTIRLNNKDLAVEEIARNSMHRCRIVKVTGQDAYFFEFMVSTGPFKIDIPHVKPFSQAQLSAYQSGQLDLAALAQQLESEVWSEA